MLQVCVRLDACRVYHQYYISGKTGLYIKICILFIIIAAFAQEAEPGSGPIYIESVDCVGDEKRLSDCPHAQFDDFHECAHEQDLGVICVVEIGKLY